MARWFNIGGPCNPADHYMLLATERLPDVVSLINKKQYFVVHAPRQCGKTTAFRALADEINAKGEMIALYCSVEAVQMFTDPKDGVPGVAEQICFNIGLYPALFGENAKEELRKKVAGVSDTAVVKEALNWVSQRVINGGGRIEREMALGSGRLDLGVHFHGAVYAVEVKKLEFFRKSPEKAYDQVVRYMDRLGVPEGWLVVADSDFSKSWDEKISTEDREHSGRTIHIVRC